MIEENAQALHKTVEAMRGIDRWGASDVLARTFAGFKQITDATSWRTVLGLDDNGPVTIAAAKQAYRALMFSGHPDRGGSDARVIELNAALATAEGELS
jgi:hypothetical protein